MSLAAVFGQTIRVVVLDDDPEFIDALNAALYAHPDLALIGYAATAGEAAEAARVQAPDVLLVDHGLPRENGVVVAERLAKQFPGVMVFLVTDSPSRELWREAVSRGLRGIVRRPSAHDRVAMDAWARGDLEAVLREAVEADRRQLSRLDEAGAGNASGNGALSRAAAPRVVAVWSAKGGVGKSTVAVNLALWAQANPVSHIPTALVDLEEGAGCAHVLLGMPARPTLLDWLDHAGNDDELDPAAVAKRVAEHATRLHCVFQPDSIAQSARVTGRLARVVVRSLRATHGLVVADCPPTLTEAVGAVLEMATVVLVVLTPDLAAINKVKLALEDVAAQGIDMTKVRLLINRVPPRPAVAESEIAAALSYVVVGSIPEDPGLHLAGNRARPPALHAQSGPFMRGLKRAAAKLVPGLELAAGRGGRRLGRLALALPWTGRR